MIVALATGSPRESTTRPAKVAAGVRATTTSDGVAPFGVSAALWTYAGNQCGLYCNSRMCDSIATAKVLCQ